MLELELASGRSVLLEGNFPAEHANREFERLSRRFDLLPLQILCRAPAEVLYERYAVRAHERHPGHVDTARLGDIRARLDPDLYRLDLAGPLLTVDTTRFETVDYDGVRSAVERHLVAPATRAGRAPR